MSMLREAEATALSTTGFGGYGSPLARGRHRETCAFAPTRWLFDNSIGAWRSRQLSPMHNVLRDHPMDALGAVDGLGHARSRGQAAKRIGGLAARLPRLAQRPARH